LNNIKLLRISASAMSHQSGITHHPFVLAPIKFKDLSPWINFDKAWTVVMGYSANDFRFVAGETPMSTLKETVLMIVAYIIIIIGGREIMRNREAYKLNTLFKIHNFMLTAISGGLLVLFTEQLIPTLWRRGLYENICGASGWTQPLVVLYYVSRDLFLEMQRCSRHIAQLSHQICRINRYSLFDGQEEASQ
jgi:fatty acid elongase 3